MFNYDLYRYYGEHKESFLQRLFRPAELRFLYWKRKYELSRNLITRFFCIVRMRWISAKTQIQIPKNTKIGRGFYIGHTGRLIINEAAEIGENVNVATGVTIGQENRGKRKGCPKIGNRVWIGTNAVIVGNIKVGDDVLIAPLTLVNFDVPDHTIVVGNPARMIHREDATAGYITKQVE